MPGLCELCNEDIAIPGAELCYSCLGSTELGERSWRIYNKMEPVLTHAAPTVNDIAWAWLIQQMIVAVEADGK